MQRGGAGREFSLSVRPQLCMKNYFLSVNQYFLSGEYKEDKIYPLYIQQITCCFELKKDKIPTIQIKGNRFIKENEYLESSEGKLYTLVLTNIDLKLFKENYSNEAVQEKFNKLFE